MSAVLERLKYWNDFTYYYFEGDRLVEASALSEVPESVEEYENIHGALSFIQKLGCIGRSQHKVKNEYHKLCLEILRKAVVKYGEVFPVLYRGVRSDRQDKESKILFGSRDRTVAEFYAVKELREYRNVKGLLAISTKQSVTSNEWSCDEEIIFFPEGCLCASS